MKDQNKASDEQNGEQNEKRRFKDELLKARGKYSEAEEELRIERDFSFSILDTAPAIILVLDLQAKIVVFNPFMERLCGYTLGEVKGEDWFETFLPQSDWERVRGVFLETVGDIETSGTINQIRTRDGKALTIEWYNKTLKDMNCKALGVLSIGLDITERLSAEEERKKLNLQMQEMQKLESLSIFAGGIAHDFNNVLMGILGYAEMTLAELEPDSPLRHNLEQIDKYTMHGSELAKQMLAYAGRGRFVIERVDLSELIKEMGHLFESVVSKNTTLNFNLKEDTPPIEGDLTQLRQVLLNVVTNASEAIGAESGVITISTGVMECSAADLNGLSWNGGLPEGECCYFEVGDTGCGMAKEVEARIFDPFFTTKVKGRGLGMAAGLGIVRNHQGGIEVSSAPGCGSSFRFLFPKSAKSAQALPAMKDGYIDWRGQGTILVVDDEDVVRAVAKAVLEKAGFKVIEAADGRQAVDLVREHGDEIAAVLLDLTMPKKSGEEAFYEMRFVKPDLRVILSSGYGRQEAVGRFAGDGLADFIQKPYHSALLIEKFRNVLSRT